ncbi:MAG TPA: cation:proton antiporter [Streptosporangiaceae bacterium]
MSIPDLAIVAALVFCWGAVSARLERYDVTAPIIFLLAGMVLTHGPVAVLAARPSHELVKGLAEATLVLLLFSDASRVGLPGIRADPGLYLRLLGIGLPLTIGLGMLAALALFPGRGIWVALLIGAALAPTDAALGSGMMLNPAVPARIRRLINVESGLNDGIATPVVTVAIAGIASGGEGSAAGPGVAAAGLVAGALAGGAIGAAGGWLVRRGRDRGWADDSFSGAAVLGLAVCAYAAAIAAHGNGFVAAFAAGLTYGSAAGRPGERLVPFVEESGALVSLLTWLAFGAVVVIPALEDLTWPVLLYAGLSLTVVRMLPVAAALTGSGLRAGTVAFVGWFGPRGLASVVFALLALEELGPAASRPAMAVITLTVLFSVLAHGASAQPLARRYGALLSSGQAGRGAAAELPVRRLTRRGGGPAGG